MVGRLPVISRALVQATLGSAAVAACLVLGGCDGETLTASSSAKANKPISEKLVAEMDKKNVDPTAPMLVRLFKQEAELEVWKQDRDGRFALVKTYPICRWSGDLGPKVREGDRQAPEGFYTITPGQMNPLSAYYLSFNIGYPNAYDRSLGRTGSQLMVHGDCSSRGCYAMTDEQIGEIYSLGREAFFGGQRAFQVQAYPFRMTPANLAKHRNNPNMPFWKMIKEGYDHFEVTHLEPKVDFCDHRYVFDAQAPAGSTRPPAFNASAACPAYEVPQDIADAVHAKQHEDEIKTAELIARGTPTARLNTGIDGGMNAVFAARVPNGQTGLSEPPEFSLASYLPLPNAAPAPVVGTIPATVNPPHPPEVQPAVTAAPAATGPAAAPASRVASASEHGAVSGGFFNTLSKKSNAGQGDNSTTASTPAAGAPAAKPAASTVASMAPRLSAAVSAAVSGPKPAGAPPAQAVQADAKSTPKPTAQANADQTISGAAPALPTNSFDNRWSSFR
ncbi:MAG: murein L,D-transpeptidase [Xanthobacteraceae bacterium]|nr:murein L,D-transpeptidase [Xanthobacteraceae bacterium]